MRTVSRMDLRTPPRDEDEARSWQLERMRRWIEDGEPYTGTPYDPMDEDEAIRELGYDPSGPPGTRPTRRE